MPEAADPEACQQRLLTIRDSPVVHLRVSAVFGAAPDAPLHP